MGRENREVEMEGRWQRIRCRASVGKEEAGTNAEMHEESPSVRREGLGGGEGGRHDLRGSWKVMFF